jgi:hypothetical protein
MVLYHSALGFSAIHTKGPPVKAEVKRPTLVLIQGGKK